MSPDPVGFIIVSPLYTSALAFAPHAHVRMLRALFVSILCPVWAQQVKYFSSSEMTKELFDSLLLTGQPAVIRGASAFWPLANWSCEDFRKSPHMNGFEVERVYGENDGTFVPLCPACEAWETDKRPSLNDDLDGPLLAPLYWEVRKEQASIDVIDTLTPPWPFLAKANHHWKRNAVEMWFSPPDAGAKYHMDGHVQMTAVSQLTGTRRWRLQLIPEEKNVGLIPNHLDSNSFDWEPEIVVTLNKGDLLVFPPGTVHDTLNIGQQCAVSVTHQLGVPYPVKFYRQNLRRLLRVADTRETWPIIADLASFGFLRPKLTLTEPFFETHSEFVAIYDEKNPAAFLFEVFTRFIDNDPKPFLGQFGNRKLREYIAYHDSDGDGVVSASEFIEGAMEWIIVERAIMEAIPDKFRPMRYFYSKVEHSMSDTYWKELDLWLSREDLNATQAEQDAKQAKEEAIQAKEEGAQGQEINVKTREGREEL